MVSEWPVLSCKPAAVWQPELKTEPGQDEQVRRQCGAELWELPGCCQLLGCVRPTQG